MHSRALVALLVMLPAGARAQETLTFSSGTGFFIHRDGYVVTNHHVVRGCSDVELHGPVSAQAATVVKVDTTHDLALLKSRALPMASAALSSEKQPLRVQDPVVVIGYPGQSWEVGEPQVREAKILRTTGPRGEEKWLEFSDSLREGNSGGPLLDASGHVVGVVVGKGRLVRPNELTGKDETVDSFDLAISLPVLRYFLGAAGVAYQEGDSGLYHSAGRIAEDARRFIVNVRCRLERP